MIVMERRKPGDCRRKFKMLVETQNTATVAPKSCRTILIIAAALVALLFKLVIAFNTFGTNDVVTFYEFGKALNENGLEWTYCHSSSFNHPPLTAYFLRAIYQLHHRPFCGENGIAFPFLLRLPGILADFVTVLALLAFPKRGRQFFFPTWALTLFALSPVSFMVSGFHGNTDPVMVMLLVLAAVFLTHGKPIWCGLFLALACQIKIIPLLLLPIFFLFWLARRRALVFALPFLFALLLLWAEPLLKFPLLFVKNVLFYGSFWGIWGITYWFRLTNLPMFKMVTFYHLLPAQIYVVTILKIIIVGAVLLIGWRRRQLNERALLNSIAYVWIVFFIFAPGVGAQYMVWLAPFILILSPALFAWLVATSSLFLFFFYNVTAHGLPWYLAISTNALNTVWTPWTVWPWATLIVALILFWREARAADPTMRLFSLKTAVG